MKKSILKVLGLSIAVLFVMTMVYSCGSSSSSSGGTPSSPTVTLTLQPSSGTVNAVGLSALIAESVSITSGKTIGTLDPAKVQVSLNPAIPFTWSVSYDGTSINIIPDSFLTANTSFSVTTSFSYTLSNKTYSTIQYNTFTTVPSAGSISSVPGSSFIVTINNISQPTGLGSLLGGGLSSIPIAVSVIAGTSPDSNGIGSMILYGGQSNSTSSPADILPNSFTIPLGAIYEGSYFKASGAVTLTLTSPVTVGVPLNPFELSGQVDSTGAIQGGSVYGIASCSAPGLAQYYSVISPYCDANGNLIIVGTITGIKNVPSKSWIGSGDAVSTIPANGATSVGTISVITLGINATATSNVTQTSTYQPYAILTMTDPTTGYLKIAGTGITSAATSFSTGTDIFTGVFNLTDPQTGSIFMTQSGTTYNAYYMFNLEPVAGAKFTY